jgi:ABC-type uncharacterized transport system ATPase subunit
LPRAEANEQKLIQLMFDKQLVEVARPRQPQEQEPRQPLLTLSKIQTRGEGAAASLSDIDLQIFPGEIVGVAGVSGNGQKELGDVVLGLEKVISGSKQLFGQDATGWSIGRVRKSGVAFIPENPSQMAAAPWLTLLQNSILTRSYRYLRYGGFAIDWKSAGKDFREAYDRLGFAPPPIYAIPKSLSGGNLQRFIIAREMAFDPKLIVASYLTRGLDVQSAIAARQSLLTARQNGAGVLLISEDLEELFTLSDRLIVLCSGRVAGEFKPEDTNLYEVGLLMTGAKQVAHG